MPPPPPTTIASGSPVLSGVFKVHPSSEQRRNARVVRNAISLIAQERTVLRMKRRLKRATGAHQHSRAGSGSSAEPGGGDESDKGGVRLPLAPRRGWVAAG